MSGFKCKCGSTEVDRDPALGNTVCTSCGTVLEETIIVSEVQFQENAGGSSSVVGQFVSADGSRGAAFGGTYHRGAGRESHDVTVERGRKRLQMLATRLRIPSDRVEAALRVFKLALGMNLTKGRTTEHITAACLYIACREEGSELMLLDFADVTQIPVYSLGHTYLQLTKALHVDLNIKMLDPALYIARFANKLQLGDKEQLVANTAQRLVQRMKRDWMAYGRRPTGLCGAALLVAARIHNFNRSVKDILKIVRIGEGTLWKRLTELERTKTSTLTIDEFQSVELEEEMDPPSFTEGKRRAKQLQAQEEERLPLLAIEIGELQKEIDSAIEAATAKRKLRGCGSAGFSSGETEAVSQADNNADVELASCQQFVDEDIVRDIEASVGPVLLQQQDRDNDEDEKEDDDVDLEKMEEEEMRQVTFAGEISASAPSVLRPTAAVLGLKDSIEECLKVSTEKEESKDNGELDLTGLDDDELDQFLLNPEEIRRKAVLWVRENAEYLKEQKVKAEREAKEKLENANKPNPKKKRAKRKKQARVEAATAGEAIERMLVDKKISSKINYEVLFDLGKEQQGATPATAAAAAPHVMSADPAVSEVHTVQIKPKRTRSATVAAQQAKKAKMEEAVIESVPATISNVVVESGPIEYAATNDADDVEDDEDEEMRGAHFNEDDDVEDGYNEDVD